MCVARGWGGWKAEKCDAAEGRSVAVRAKSRKVRPRRQARSCGKWVCGGHSVKLRKVGPRCETGQQKLVLWSITYCLFLRLLLLLLFVNNFVAGSFLWK